MALKNMLKFMQNKKDVSLPEKVQEETGVFLTSEDFPIFRAEEIPLSQYQKIPLTELAALGAAFSTLPESARTITKMVTTTVKTNGPIFTGLWPQGVNGKIIDKGLGFSGNIIGDLSNGGKGIIGRMRFRLLEQGVPVTEVTKTVAPFQPMTVLMAAALIGVNRKLDGLQAKAEKILQFMKQEKQTRQRGNLNMLAEIMEEYKHNGQNDQLCALRAVAVQNVKQQAHQDLLFYEEQITGLLQEQKNLHSVQEAKKMQESIAAELFEYQLANYLYAYASFLEILLHKNFDLASTAEEKMEKYAQKYKNLYQACRTQLASYQQNAIETKVLDGIGKVTKTVGQKLAAVPILNKGPVDEALIDAGNALNNYSKERAMQRLEAFSAPEESGMETFMENTRQLELLYERPEGILTDGENVYILKAA